MTSDEGRTPEGAPERSPKAGVGAASDVDGNGPKRFSVQRKIAIVARLLRGPRWARSPWTTNCSTPRSRRWRANALWPTGGRDDEPDALALQCSLLWLGARCARVVGLACALRRSLLWLCSRALPP